MPHCFACVEWFKEHRNQIQFRNPSTVYYAKVFKQLGPATFIPVPRVQSRFIAVYEKDWNISILIASSILQKIRI